MNQELEKLFAQIASTGDFCSLRYLHQRDEVLTVRQDVPEPPERSDERGAMVTVIHNAGLGYAATCDLTARGLKRAAETALRFAKATTGRSVTDYGKIAMPRPTGEYAGPNERPWASVGLADKFDLLMKASRGLKTDPRIVDWHASVWHIDLTSLYLTSAGGRTLQTFSYMSPALGATANEKAVTQTRTLGSLRGNCRQGGAEVLAASGFNDASRRIAEEAIALLSAENCPTGRMDLLLESDQMFLQIHESIGHPLELDRILGDERNYAGTSFVRPEMFGSYQYGSPLLNVTFDPTLAEQFASYRYDDEGLEAKREYIIKGGTLVRGLGGATSQARVKLPGVASCRACSWNRPPIDRMANLNVEPGASKLAEMIAAVKRGVYMKTNKSWSIDDSRNKFQFGCEWGRLIEDGKLTRLVRNPNYRGISATFWRSLKMAGDRSTFGVHGTPFCGKGEPGQGVRVGHASPACLFTDVEVFGGV